MSDIKTDKEKQLSGTPGHAGPVYKYLDKINSPSDIKSLTADELKELAAEIRTRILSVTSKKGGHLAASLGAVELAIALHYSLNSPKDKIVWDVGHQSYAHKIITGRNRQFDTLREMGGLSGFPNKEESEHDPFTCGHSSTSISSALGLALARDLKGELHKVVAVIGDASLSTGLAFEGLNHAGHVATDLVVILNDNEHSISRPVEAMSRYLNKLITNPLYNRIRVETEKFVKGIPRLGPSAYVAVHKFQEGIKNLIVPGIIFEELGFRYFGPIDGHNIKELIAIFKNAFALKRPILIHVITKKGKGYRFAEEDPVRLHGVTSFDIETGQDLHEDNGLRTFTHCFSDKISELGVRDRRVVTISAAMKEGVGLEKFAGIFPHRFFDVGITEEHAVTFAAGLARGGLRPFIAVYSAFLQRSYDQLIHDIALQNLPVVFCIDRAGLVGKDGPTHHGVFDIAYTRTLPNFVVMAPKDGYELEKMLEKAIEFNRPVAIRYPRDYSPEVDAWRSVQPVRLGKSETLCGGSDMAIIAVGSMVKTAFDAASILSSKYGIKSMVVNARFIKPLDGEMLEDAARRVKKIVLMEEGMAAGGFGSAVIEFFEREGINDVRVRQFALPDIFIEHGSRQELLRKYHLTPYEVAEAIRSEMF